MNTAALGLIAAGGVLLFYLLHSHYAKLSGSSGGGSPTSGTTGGGTSTTSGDTGSHMGLDANGNTVVIHSTYGNMTDQQKDSANAFARRYPNGA